MARHEMTLEELTNLIESEPDWFVQGTLELIRDLIYERDRVRQRIAESNDDILRIYAQIEGGMQLIAAYRDKRQAHSGTLPGGGK